MYFFFKSKVIDSFKDHIKKKQSFRLLLSLINLINCLMTMTHKKRTDVKLKRKKNIIIDRIDNFKFFRKFLTLFSIFK